MPLFLIKVQVKKFVYKLKMDQKKHIYILRVVLVSGISIGSQSLNLNDKHIWMYTLARYVLYIVIMRAVYGACELAYDVVRNKRRIQDQFLKEVNKNQALIFLAAITFLLFNEQPVVDSSFFKILMLTIIAKYPVIMKKKKIPVNYAVGMACSYFEGYLVHILISDGAKFFGFQNNIRSYEAVQGVVFPVNKLFIVAARSLYSPPALEDLNKSDRDDVAKLEACTALTEIEKDVAGVKNRIYRNFAYKIYRPNGPPVCLAAGGGTPMHTLFNVLKNKDLSQELAGINREEIVADFFKALNNIIAKSPECKDKCELIYFDDTDRNLNLADVLLDRIRELEPKFEEIIAQRR